LPCEIAVVLPAEQFEVTGEHEMVLELTRRPDRDRTESGQFGIAATPAAFRQVRRNRRGRSMQLRRQAVQFVTRNALRDLVDLAKAADSEMPPKADR